MLLCVQQQYHHDHYHNYHHHHEPPRECTGYWSVGKAGKQARHCHSGRLLTTAVCSKRLVILADSFHTGALCRQCHTRTVYYQVTRRMCLLARTIDLQLWSRCWYIGRCEPLFRGVVLSLRCQGNGTLALYTTDAGKIVQSYFKINIICISNPKTASTALLNKSQTSWW